MMADNERDATSRISARFPRQARLLTPAGFQRVFAKGRRINARHLQLIVRIRDNDDETTDARIGLTVAKRVAKRAVDRNRIKRIARDSFRRNQQRLHGLDLVLVARGGITDLPRIALHEALESLWQRAETLKPAAQAVKLAPPSTAADATSDTSPVTPPPRDASS